MSAQLNLLLRNDAEKKIQCLQATQEETTVESDQFQQIKEDIHRRTESTKESYKGMLVLMRTMRSQLQTNILPELNFLIAMSYC